MELIIHLFEKKEKIFLLFEIIVYCDDILHFVKILCQ